MNEIEIVEKKFGVLDHVPVGICILKKDFSVLFWNSCIEVWTGIHRSNILGTNIISHFPHLSSSKYYSRLQNIFDGGPPTIFSSQLHRYIIPSQLHDGQLRIQHTTVTPVHSLGENEFYALLVIQDVTDLTHSIHGYRAMRDQAIEEIKERKHAEEKLRNAHEGLELRVKERTADLVLVNEKLQQEIAERKKVEDELKRLVSTLNTLVDHMPEGVVLLDAENRVVLANNMGGKYLNTTAGIGIGDVLTGISGYPLQSFLTSAPHKMWHEVRLSSPQKYIFELAGRTISQNNIISGMVLVLKDVTEERMLEERIHSQERLASVGQLAAGIAHDFNNILTGIIGSADILLVDYMLPYEERQIVEAVMRSGQRAAQLIRQILDFSRKSISEMKAVDLMPFLRELSEFIRRIIPENIDITVDCEQGEHVVLADPAKIQQVLVNLAVNARDAMPAGGRLKFTLSRIGIKAGGKSPIPESSIGDWIVLTVADKGSGIAPDVLPHIFDPFFTTKDVGKGTGLGLSQVYGIIKQHEGYTVVESEVGKGSTFIIYLPASKTKPDVLPMKEDLIMPKGQTETILVVEDNKAVRDLVQRKLVKLDYEVLIATNGKDALRIFEERHADIKLVITDLVMPEIGGVELSKSLKSKNPAIKIIALSGYPLGSEKEDLLNAGIMECIQKPFQVQELAGAVCRMLGRTVDDPKNIFLADSSEMA